MQELSVEDVELSGALAEHVLDLRGQGLSDDEIRLDLVELGYEEDPWPLLRQAEKVSKESKALLSSEPAPDDGSTDMMVGGLFFVGGIVVTAMTYSMAEGGGSYVITWGAIVFGAIQFFRGLDKCDFGDLR